ncbi:MAG: hypothetical protein G01um101433_549 [Parcubacteria group bacterium Gr01-1014_33]|nr:MAG: hypothetical protein G01um101433_549 [Parcubacteria group bacterium Gr01-1014_33]
MCEKPSEIFSPAARYEIIGKHGLFREFVRSLSYWLYHKKERYAIKPAPFGAGFILLGIYYGEYLACVLKNSQNTSVASMFFVEGPETKGTWGDLGGHVWPMPFTI